MDNHQARSSLCLCASDRGLYIPQRQLSLLLAAAIMTSTGVFIGGYFYGKKESLEQINDLQEHEAFADQIYTAVCQGYSSMPVQESDTTTVTSTAKPIEDEPLSIPTQAVDSSASYYYELIGFGTAKAAQQFAKKLEKKGFPVLVKTRYSTTPRNKKIVWYQVVTSRYQDRQQLEQLVDRIAKEEKLKDVRIVIS